MKSLLLVSLLTLPLAAHAGPEISVGAAGGVLVTDPLEVLGSGWTAIPRVGYGFDKNVGLELDLGIAGGTTRIGEHPYMAFTPRLNFVGKLWTKSKKTDGKVPPIHPLLAAGFGGFYKNTSDDGALGSQYNRKDLDFLANAGPGLMVPLGKTLHLRTDLRWVLSLGQENFRNRGDQFINWEWTAGVGLTFGGDRDQDNDGILDENDRCKTEPEDIDAFEDEDGCPDLDNDKDGIADVDDQCKNEAEDDDDFEDDDGCPDPDNDGDEIADADDMCPLEAGAKSAKGCPDQDGDSVQDSEDECVDEAGSVEAFGCPDDDEDRVPNYRDQCPDEKAPAKADARRSDGCLHRVFITKDAIRITEKVFFDVDKSTIKSESHALLDEVASTLKKYTGIKKVSVEGHTDNTGEAEYNKKLSNDRANSVRTYLIENDGIAADRLEAKGFGQEKPLVDGDAANTDEGRAKNRRVEFNITEQDRKALVLRRPTFDFDKMGDEDHVNVKGLTPKTQPTPKDGFVKKDATCEANVAISAEGEVERVIVTKCAALARFATESSLRMWTFEPYEVKGKAKAVTTTFKVEYKDGKSVFSHRAKDLKVREDAE